MPNWCVNRIKLSGKTETIEHIVEDIQRSNDVILLQNQAIRAAIKLFICTEYELIEGFNGSKHGVKFKHFLNNHEPLTEDICKQLISIYKKSAVEQIVLSDISASKQQKVIKAFETQAYDWFEALPFELGNIAEYWQSLDPDTIKVNAQSTIPFEHGG